MSPNAKQENDFFVSKAGRYYFLVGKYGNDVHKDHLFFSFTVSKKGDLDSETDAGSTSDTALTIVPGSYQSNFWGLGDKEDHFKLTAKKDEAYVFTMLPRGKESPTIYFYLVDSLKIDVSHESRGGGSGQGLQVKFTVPEDGDYYVIAKYSGDKRYSDYEIKLTKRE